MLERTFEATIDNIPKVEEFVHEGLDAFPCSMKVLMQIDIAIDELFGNIAHYAYDGIGHATVRLEFEEPLTVKITFIDKGKPYNPLAKEDPDIELPLDQRPVGGLGIFMVKQTMDSMEYEYKDGQNILTLWKKLL